MDEPLSSEAGIFCQEYFNVTAVIVSYLQFWLYSETPVVLMVTKEGESDIESERLSGDFALNSSPSRIKRQWGGAPPSSGRTNDRDSAPRSTGARSTLRRMKIHR